MRCQSDILEAIPKKQQSWVLAFEGNKGEIGGLENRDENCPNQMMTENQEPWNQWKGKLKGMGTKSCMAIAKGKGTADRGEGGMVCKGEREEQVPLQNLVLKNHDQSHNEMFWPLGKSLRASYSASSCCVQIDQCHIFRGFVLLCVELGHGSRQCHDQPCHILMLSNYGSVVIGVYGGVCFTPGNKCSICLGMSINKISALIAIDLFIHYNTVQWKPTLLHCHSPCSNNGRALAKSILHSKAQDFRWGQTSVKLPAISALPWNTRGHRPSLLIALDKGLMFTFASSIICSEWEEKTSLSFLSTSIQQWRTKLPRSESVSFDIPLVTRRVCSLQRCLAARWLALLNNGDKSSLSCQSGINASPAQRAGRAAATLRVWRLSPKDARLLLCRVYKASGFYATFGSVGSWQYNKTSSLLPGRRQNT